MELALNLTQTILAREQRLSALGGLAAAAAHELGTPLATISVVAREMVRESTEGSMREDAELLVAQAERLRSGWLKQHGLPQALILNNLAFSVGAGQMIGVVGPSGAGKSTLARVLAGALRPERGQVRIDHAAMTDWDENSLAAHIGYMPQDFVLFAGSVKDNISRFEGVLSGEPAAVDAAAVAAAQSAGAHEMILHLPKGYDTILGMNGAGLSAGQAQRIALARALYRDPRILILDEPNAHLDAEGEAHLTGLLSALKDQGRTIIVVAHRNSVLAAADRILVLKEGRVAAYGTLAEMLAETGRAMQAAAASSDAPAVAPAQKRA